MSASMHEQQNRVDHGAEILHKVILRDPEINRLQHEYACISLGFCPNCTLIGDETSDLDCCVSKTGIPESDWRYEVYYAYRNDFMTEVLKAAILPYAR